MNFILHQTYGQRNSGSLCPLANQAINVNGIAPLRSWKSQGNRILNSLDK